jgi:hypothetical protein
MYREREMKEGGGEPFVAESRAESRPRLDCVDVLATAQQSFEHGAMSALA